MASSRLRHFAHFSAIATALVASAGLLIAVWQIKASESSQREASARDAYKEYLKLAISQPEIADLRLPSNLPGPVRQASYSWFVSYFLYSAEQVFDSFPGEIEWEHTLSEEICYHQSYLQSPAFQATGKRQHSPEFAGFIDRSLQQCPDQ